MAEDTRIPRSLSASTGALLVVASMVGTGVFTTTGFLVRDLGSPLAVLVAWCLGAVLALLGALAYAELVAALPNNGGEYQLLSRIYHPALGFTSGWVSLIVGFSAPMAASAVAFGEYLKNVVPGAPPELSALALVIGLGLLHALRISWGSRVQDAMTVLDCVLILGLIAAGFVAAEFSPGLSAHEGWGRAVLSPEFAIGLIYVSFAYSGWNAAAYVAGELKQPERSLPRALFAGTATVGVLYIGLNAVFLVSAPLFELSGVVDVGHVAVRHLFGERPAQAMSLLVSIGLFTTVSALMMTGPRVYEAMGKDYPRLQRLSGTDRAAEHGPTSAILLQTLVATCMVLTASFEALLTYMGFVLSLFSTLAIAGVFVLRAREPALPRPYRTWGHPFSTCAALLLNVWVLVHAVWQRPWQTVAGFSTVLVGLALYFVVRRSPRA